MDVDDARVSTVGQQLLHWARVVQRGGCHERGVAVDIGRVEISAVADEDSDGNSMIECTRDMQRRPA